MYAFQVQHYLSKLDPTLRACVYAANRLPIYVTTPAYLISNLDSDSEPGSHWVAIHIDQHGVGQYFDSFGRPPTRQHKEFLYRNATEWDYNPNRIQDDSSLVCGHYSLTYLYYRYHGRTINDFILDLFGDDTRYNDEVVLREFQRCFINT